MSNTLLKVFFTLLFCTASANLFASYEKAGLIFKEAKILLKKGDKSKNSKILALLKKAQSHLLEIEEFTPEQETMLSKINSHIYWQVKFGTVNDVSTKVTIPKKIAKLPKKSVLDPKADSKWKAEKKAKDLAFNKALDDVQQYEQKHRNDNFSNLLNYLNLHEKVVNENEGGKIIDKTSAFSANIEQQKALTLKNAMADIEGYDKYILKKDYKGLVKKIAGLIKYTKLSPKAKVYMKQLYYETIAMRSLKSTLMMKKPKAIPFPNIIKGFVGVVTKVDKEGIHLVSEGTQKSSLGWEIISEKNLLTIAKHLIKGTSETDTHILAFANMRLKNYSEAYKLFKKLIDIDTGKILRYKDYLSLCEAGHRIKAGTYIEKTCARAKKLAKKGQKEAGLDLIINLFEKYADDDLAKAYHERILFAYNEVLRS